MDNCIFTAHCTEMCCDQSCPILVETSYLLERNGIQFSNPVFSKYSNSILDVVRFLDKYQHQTRRVLENDLGVKLNDAPTVQKADLITYCAICKYWKGSQLHCTVYNLRYSKYLEEMKKSWTTGSESEILQMMRIWSESCKVLIISNFDYVKFGDFESQTLLNLIQSRESQALTTILVGPSTIATAPNGLFTALLRKALHYPTGITTKK